MGRREEPDLKRDAGFVTAINREVEGVMASFLEFELLDIDDEIAREKIAIGRKPDIGGQFDAGHDGTAVFIDEIHPNAVRAFFDATEDESKGDRALRMNGWQLMCDDGVEGAEQIELAGIIRGGITEHSDLNVHSEFPLAGGVGCLRAVN